MMSVDQYDAFKSVDKRENDDLENKRNSQMSPLNMRDSMAKAVKIYDKLDEIN